MKRLLSFVVVLLVIGAAAVACSANAGQPAPTDQPTPQAQVTPVAQMTPVTQVTPEVQTATGDATQGRQLFVVSCSACHGPNGEGVKGLGKDMQHSEFIASLTDEELLAFIKAGRPSSDPKNETGVDMPPKGGNPALTDEQLLDIVAYLRSIHQ